MTDLKIRSMNLVDLKHDADNIRKHDQRNIEAIKKSLDLFGQRKPVVITADNVVIAGNGTMEAARELGWPKLDVVQVPDDWDHDKARAFAIADNRTAELASWDETGLADAIVDLDAAGYNVQDLGFDPAYLDDADDVEQDSLPAMDQIPSRTKLGQLWQLGNHKLKVGDATDADDFRDLMGDDLADCVLTDPPYNVAYQGGTADALTIMNDNMIESEFEKFMQKTYELMYEHTAPGGAIYVFHADTSGHLFRQCLINSGFLLKQCLIWVKDTFVLGRQDYHWQHEPILYGWKPGAGHNWYGKRIRSTVQAQELDLDSMKKQELLELLKAIQNDSTVINVDKPRRNGEHPTMKPLELLARLVANSTARGNIIIDPFAGSGSTMIVCEQMQRTCYSMENDPRYADVIIKRWENLTNGKAKLIHD